MEFVHKGALPLPKSPLFVISSSNIALLSSMLPSFVLGVLSSWASILSSLILAPWLTTNKESVMNLYQ